MIKISIAEDLKNMSHEQLIQEVQRLKIKCNLQQEKLLEFRKMSEKKEVEQPEKKQKKVEKKSVEISGKNDIENFSLALVRILCRLRSGEMFLKYKKDCKNSREFVRLKSEDLQGVAANFIEESNLNNFYKFCSGIGVFKNDRKNCIFNDLVDGKSVKVVFIRKEIFQYIEGGNEQ